MDDRCIVVANIRVEEEGKVTVSPTSIDFPPGVHSNYCVLLIEVLWRPDQLRFERFGLAVLLKRKVSGSQINSWAFD